MPLFSNIIAATISLVPKPIVGYFAKPYIAGSTLEDGIRVVKDLNAAGIMATMDVLGEGVSTREESLEMTRQAEEVLHAIAEHKLDANLSIKPTQLGLTVDESFCEQNIRTLCEVARGYDNFVRIDMEDHPYTDMTLNIYKRLREEFPGHVGVVLQSYMRRIEADMTDLMNGGDTNIRLCKGIYVEPEDIAYKNRREIQDSFDLVNELGLAGGAYVGIATHDDFLIENAYALIEKLGLKREQYEFQMLLGVRPRLRRNIVSKGHRMRVYVPFGEQWYAYSTRRLKENPAMAVHVLKSILGLNR